VALVADSNLGRNTTKTAPQTSFRGSCSSKGRGGKAVLAVTVASAKKAAPMRGLKTAQKKLPVAVLAAVAAAPCTLHPRRLLRLRSRGFGKEKELLQGSKAVVAAVVVVAGPCLSAHMPLLLQPRRL
jgi:hypothetical protein